MLHADILPEVPICVDSTMLTNYKSCQRKFAYSFLHNLRPKGRSVHLVAGAAFASGLEKARKHCFATTEKVDQAELEEVVTPAFMKAWGDYEAPPDSPKSYENTLAALLGYLEQYHPQRDSIQPMRNKAGVPQVEFSFAIPLPVQHPGGESYIFAGRFDMLGLYNDLPCIVDEKTTSALGAYWLKQFDLRGQFLGYCWACRELGIPVNHVFVRGIAIKKRGHDFLVAPQQYPDFLIDRWFENACMTLADLTAKWQSGIMPYNFGDSCAAYGGCSFIPLCQSATPTDWFDTYDVELWEPIKSHGDG